MLDQATTEIEMPPRSSETAASDRSIVTEAVPGTTGTEPRISAWLPSAEDSARADRRSLLISRRRLSVLWARRGLWLGSVAISISFVCTLLLAQDEPMRTGAWAGLIVAGLLAIVAWGGTPWLSAFARPGRWWPLERPTFGRVACLFGIAGSVVLIWQANTQFAAHRLEMFGLAGWLWLSSMALLLASTAAWPQPWKTGVRQWRRRNGRAPATANNSALGPEEIAQSSVPFVAAPYASLPVRVHKPQTEHPAAIRQADAQPLWTRWEIALFLGIVTLAVVLRVWDLTNFPFVIHSDEIITGRIATQSYVNGYNPPLFGTLWNGIDLPALWFLGVAQSLKLGGATLAALRLPAALFGAAAVVPLYFLIRQVWGRAAAITGASLMSFGVASLHFSRITLNNVVTPFFWTACFFFLLRGLRRGRPIDWVLAGIFGGLSEHFYYGTRLLPSLLIGFALYLLLVHWRRAKYHVLSFGLVIAGYMAALGPLFTWFTLNPGLYFGRGAGVLTWNHIPLSLEDLRDMWNTLWPIFSTNLLTVSTYKANDDLYFGPMLLPVEATLLVLGVALLIWRWRQPASFLLLASGLGVLFFGGTLIPVAGNVHHWTPAFPAFYAALALPVGGLAWASGQHLSRRFQYIAAGLLAVVLVVLGVLNVNYYFAQYYSYRPEMDILAAKARLQAQLGPQYRVRSIGASWQSYDQESTSYLVKGVDGAQVINPSAELPLPGVPGKGMAFTFFPDQVQYLGAVEAMYPGGTHGQFVTRGGILLFDYYTVPADTVEAMYGATLQHFAPGATAPITTERTERIGTIPGSVDYPVRARWTALLYLPVYTPITLTVEGADASVLLDGHSAQTPPGRPVQPGWHQVSVAATLDRPSQIKLMLTEGSAQPVEVPRERLWAVGPGSGLLGSVAAPDTSAGPLVRNEQFIGFSGLLLGQTLGPQFASAWPVRVRWQGEIYAGGAGNYQLEIRTDGQSRLTVGGATGGKGGNSQGATTFGTCPGNTPFPATANVQWDAGWHPFQLDFIAAGSGNTFELSWTPPGGQKTIIPPTAFRFATETSEGTATPPVPPADWNCSAP